MAGPRHPGLDAEAPAAAVGEWFLVFLRNKARGSCCWSAPCARSERGWSAARSESENVRLEKAPELSG